MPSALVAVLATAALVTGAGPATAAPITINTGGAPRLIAMTPDGTKAYIGDSQAGGKVYVLDLATDTVSSIAIAGIHEGIAVSPDGSTVYATTITLPGPPTFTSDNEVSVISTATNTVINTIGGLGAFPQFVALTPNGAKAYVSNYNGASVSVIDTATHAVTSTITGIAVPRQIVISPDGSTAYVASYGSNQIEVIDTATDSITTTIPVSGSPWGMAMTPDGTTIYATRDQGGLFVVNTTTNAVTQMFTTGISSDTTNVTLSPDGLTAYVTDTSSNDMQLIDLATGAVKQTVSIPSPGDPFGLAFTKDGSKLYVANNFGSGGTLSEFAVPKIAATAPGALTIGAPFSFAVASSASPTFAVTAGALPPGLTLAASSGVISGTPTTAGVANFTITATGTYGTNARAYSVTTAAAALATVPAAVPATDPTAVATLPATGANSIPLTMIGATMLIAGGALLLFSRRRRPL